MGPVSPLLPFDQSRFPQTLQVLGNGPFGDFQTMSKGTHAEVMGQEQLDQLEPRLIRKGFHNLDKFRRHDSNIHIQYFLYG
jgi:hypothetical protein